MRFAPCVLLSKLLARGPATAPGRRQSSPLVPRCTKAEAGALGEELAARHLAALGMRLLGRNLEAPEAELDVVAIDGPYLVVVEVKTGWFPEGRSEHRPGDHFSEQGARRRAKAASRLAARDAMRPRVDLMEVLVGRGRSGVEIVHWRGYR